MFEIMKVLNLNEIFFVDENLLVMVGMIDLLKGGSWSGNKLLVMLFFGFNNFLMKKKLVLYVENDNNFCLFIVIGLCFLKMCKKVDVEFWFCLIGNDVGFMMN